MFRFIIILALIFSLALVSYNNNSNVYHMNCLLIIYKKETILLRNGGVKKSSLYDEVSQSNSNMSDTIRQYDMCNSKLLYPTYGHSKRCFSHL